MADPVVIPAVDESSADVDMEGTNADEILEPKVDESELPGAGLDEEVATRIAFLDYLKSPIVELVVGSGPESITLSCHQDLLTKSPFFEQACADLAGKTGRRTIELVDEDAEAMGSFLEYLYMGEYFPRRIGEGREGPLETHPSIPTIDGNGEQLLKHARIYSLADKFAVPALKSLAHSKIHRTTSTAQGEIAYARYVYAHTSTDDTTIRRPVAAFWATRSHVLRHEAEEEFRAMCLEFPQFGFDVLSMVLDQKEKRTSGAVGISGNSVNVSVEAGGSNSPAPGMGRGRKRVRASVDT